MANKKIEIIRWGIIGCGDVTEVKSGPAYQKTKGFELVAVMRRDAIKCADSLINDPEIDAIYIATPPDSHKLYALKVAMAGKTCCIEKPMASNYEDSLAIYKAFKEKEIPLFIAYYRRSLPRFNQIKKWLDANEIGEIRHVSWQLSKPPSTLDLSGNYNWRTDSKVAKGGYFDDLASHGLDLFVHLLGQMKAVSGFSSNQQGLYSAKDSITACWIHESGVTGTGNWNFGCKTHQDKVVIFGSNGKIEFSIFGEKPLFLENKKGKIEILIEHPKNVQLFHVENIRAHLLGNKTHPSLGESGLHTSWIMHQIIEKM